MNSVRNCAVGLAFVSLMGLSATLQACSQKQTNAQNPANVILIDGSSTVFPITNKIAQSFQENQDQNNQSVEIKTSFSGTGGGFTKFCAGETDINNASRPITLQEMAACRNNGVGYIELPVAFDALTIVVNPENSWADNITVEELQQMWQPAAENTIKTWQQIRPSWPNKPLTLYGPGEDSGTFDYFTEAIVGTAKASRSDYVKSEDDEVLVQGVAQDSNALGYFGYAYYEENKTQLKALAVDQGKGAILPTSDSVKDAKYQPLSRPMFIYVNAKAAQDKAAVQSFVEYYLKTAPSVVKTVGYIPLPEEGYRLAQVHFHRGKIGTVFDGKAEISLTLGELLRKQEKY